MYQHSMNMYIGFYLYQLIFSSPWDHKSVNSWALKKIIPPHRHIPPHMGRLDTFKAFHVLCPWNNIPCANTLQLCNTSFMQFEMRQVKTWIDALGHQKSFISGLSKVQNLNLVWGQIWPVRYVSHLFSKKKSDSVNDWILRVKIRSRL